MLSLRPKFQQFKRYLPAIYPLATEILLRDMTEEVRDGIRLLLVRTGLILGLA